MESIDKLIFSYTNVPENSSLSTLCSDKFIVFSYTNVPENSSLSTLCSDKFIVFEIHEIQNKLNKILYELKYCISINDLNIEPFDSITNDQLFQLMEYRLNNLSLINHLCKELLNKGFYIYSLTNISKNNFFTDNILSYLSQISQEYFYYLNIDEINKHICWIYRKNYISFYEGCYFDNSHITKFLFNDLILKEICSYIYDEI